MAKNIKEIKLGSRVKDMITGFTGMANARCIYYYGCIQIEILSEQLDKDNKEVAIWFDEPRIVILEETKSYHEPNHGPQKCPPPSRRHP